MEPSSAPAVAKASQAESVPPDVAKASVSASAEKIQPAAKSAVIVTAKATVPVKTEKAGSREYVVKAGDTLSRLSQQFYETPSKWGKIYEANRDHVKNPNYIFIGMKLIIPPDA
jgi:nucleoid-associated protein YgaU